MEAVGVCNPIALWFLLLYSAVQCCSKSGTAETFFLLACVLGLATFKYRIISSLECTSDQESHM